jgi:hypothetical protein
MGLVLEARQTSLDRKVAIKLLAPELAGNATFVARFQREAASLARLTHPNIITIYERGRAGDFFYLIMEYVEGPGGRPPTNLRHLIDEGKLDAAATRKLVLQIAGALDFAHRQKIIHRDVKPSNVLVDLHGNAKVADFGIAATAGPDRTLTTAGAMGTPDYMAPEQRRNAGAVDERADVFSVGVILYEMLTGDLPLGSCRPPSERVPGLDPAWDAVVRKALEPQPQDRFAGMAELAAAVERIGTGPPPAWENARGAGRADVLARANAQVAEGKLKSAIRVLEEGVRLFPGDAEVVGLLARCRDKVVRAQKAVQERVPALVREKKLCELAGLYRELRNEGVPIRGLEEQLARLDGTLARAGARAREARRHLDEGRPAEARKEAGRVLETVADHAEAREVMELAGRQTGRHRLAGLAGRANPFAPLLAWSVLGAAVWLAAGKGASFLAQALASREGADEAAFLLPQTAGALAQASFAALALSLLAGGLTRRLKLGLTLAVAGAAAGGALLTGVVMSRVAHAEWPATWPVPAVRLVQSAPVLFYGLSAAAVIGMMTARVLGDRSFSLLPPALWAGGIAALVGTWARDPAQAPYLPALIPATVFTSLLALTGACGGWLRLAVVPVAALAGAAMEDAIARAGRTVPTPVTLLIPAVVLATAGAGCSFRQWTAGRLLTTVVLAAAVPFACRWLTAVALAPPAEVLLLVWFLVMDAVASAQPAAVVTPGTTVRKV